MCDYSTSLIFVLQAKIKAPRTHFVPHKISSRTEKTTTKSNARRNKKTSKTKNAKSQKNKMYYYIILTTTKKAKIHYDII